MNLESVVLILIQNLCGVGCGADDTNILSAFCQPYRTRPLALCDVARFLQRPFYPFFTKRITNNMYTLNSIEFKVSIMFSTSLPSFD